MTTLKVGNDPLKGRLVGIAVTRVLVRHGVAILTLRVQQIVEGTFRELPQGRLGIPLVRLHRSRHDLQVPAPLWRAGPWDEPAVQHRLLQINHTLFVDLQTEAKSGAGFASAVRGVKAEGTRLQVINDRAVVGASELLAEEPLLKGWLLFLGWRRSNNGETFAQLDRRLYRVGEPAAIRNRERLPLLIDRMLHHESVHDDFNRVALLLVELRQIVGAEVVLDAIHAHAAESRLSCRFIHALAFALAIAQEWAEHEDARTVWKLEDLFHDLIQGDTADRAITLRAVRGAGTRVKESEVIPNLGDRANRRARIARRALLVDGNRWREPIDGVDVGLLHLPKELACVR